MINNPSGHSYKYLFILYCTVNCTTAFSFRSSLLNKLSLMPRALSTNQIQAYQSPDTVPEEESNLKLKPQCPLTLLHGLAPGEGVADDRPPTQISEKKRVALDRLVG